MTIVWRETSATGNLANFLQNSYWRTKLILADKTLPNLPVLILKIIQLNLSVIFEHIT